jgi:hypothetical protein
VRYTRSGASRSHVVHTGYRHTSTPHARFERPEGEPSLLTGTLFLAMGIGVIVTAILFLGALR